MHRSAKAALVEEGCKQKEDHEGQQTEGYQLTRSSIEFEKARASLGGEVLLVLSSNLR